MRLVHCISIIFFVCFSYEIVSVDLETAIITTVLNTKGVSAA